MATSKDPGKVYLVGAGPGDPELLTVKALRLIRSANVILYDALVGDGIRELFPSGAVLVDVGKRADKHRYPQEEINRMLVDMASSRGTVVRLKGGDPYVFGRGSEEAAELARNGIPYEVVPGITSAIAAPASAGIPVTHRGLASAVTFVTGHEDPGKAESSIDYRALAALGGTLVILMGIERLAENVKALLDAGKGPETPVAIVENGTTAEERVTSGTLGDIVDRARGVKAPAVIIVGDVVRMREKLGYK